jgi:hypothetical protein
MGPRNKCGDDNNGELKTNHPGVSAGVKSSPLFAAAFYEHPLVDPQVSHFRHVPFLTIV